MSRTDRTKPFHRITVENAFNAVVAKAVLIEWEMEDWFVDEGPWVFTVYRTQREDLEGWEQVAQVVNQAFAYDTDQNSYGVGVFNYYKVTVTTAKLGEDGEQCVYESDPLLAGNNLSRRDWRLLREILRKETLLFEKRTGARGWLCPWPRVGPNSGNVDPNTGEIITSQDSADFGTGKEGGYWGPVETFIQLGQEKRLTKLTTSGKISATIRTARVLAYPRFYARDVWVNGMTDERFVVGANVIKVADIRGVPIKYDIELDLVEAGNVIYEIPVPMQV